MIKIKDLSAACDTSDYKLSKLLRELGMDVLLNEATRLQSIACWDKKIVPPRNEIDMKYVKDAYKSLTNTVDSQ